MTVHDKYILTDFLVKIRIWSMVITFSPGSIPSRNFTKVDSLLLILAPLLPNHCAGEPTAVAAAACHPPTDGSSRPACRTPTDHRTPSHVTRQRARIGPTDAGVTRSAGVAVPCVRRRGNCYVMASREEEGVGSRGRPLAGAAALREG